MSVIQFPKLPKNHYYEDYVSAIMVLSRCFLERGIVKKESSSGKEDVLELDIVASSYSRDSIQKYLVELKGGKNWGFQDLFKIRGWMDYLGLDKARFIVQEAADKPIELIREEIKVLGIDLVLNEFDSEKGVLNNSELCGVLGIESKDIPEQTVEMLCYSFLIEDLMCNQLMKIYRSSDIDNGRVGFDRLNSYLHRIKHSSFFLFDPRNRAKRIFDAYSSNVSITAKIACERAGDDYDNLGDAINIPPNIFKEIFYIPQKKSPYHVSLYVELLNKLLILKCCVDYKLVSQTADNKDETLPEWIKQYKDSTLPAHLQEGLDIISQDPYFFLYPHFWQIFVYLFGGFILEEKKEEEYKHLSKVSGIPVEHIDNALSCFDHLFKIEGGWFVSLDGVKHMKLFPSPFSGIGANYRLQLYIKDKEAKIEELQKVISSKAFDRLVSWNNLAVAFLETDKNVILS